MNRHKWEWGGVALLGICSAVLLFATNFQLQPVSTTDIQKVAWQTGSISWSLNPTNTIVYKGSGTLAVESDLQSVLSTAFSLWSGAQYQSTNVNTLAFTEGADNTNTSFAPGDCVNSIGFTQSFSTGTIAQTQVVEVSTTTPSSPAGNYPCAGAPTRTCPNEVCLVDADIEFNSNSQFYTSAYTNPPDGYFDLGTVAAHEIGHLIGLDHSGLANAVMYPYGDSGTGGVKAALAIDDVIGSEALYPNSAIASLAGSIQGRVTLGNSPAISAFAAHVVAIDATTGNVITDTLADSSGNYSLRVFQGTYYVLVLPLATDTSGDSGTNGVTDIGNYSGFSSGYPSSTAQTGFTGKYY